MLLRFSESIFLTDVPGIKILIPYYYKAMEQILFTENFTQLEPNWISILGSVILDPEDNKNKDLTSTVITAMKITTLKLLKSFLFMGYTLTEFRLVTLPEARVERGRPGMKFIREETFCIVYKLLEKMKKVRLRTVATLNFAEYSDVEFQYNLFTLATVILHLECNQSTKPITGILDISLDVRILNSLHS